MPKLQLISCYVNLGGDRNNVAYRGPANPVTFAEALVLQAVHGGQEHVHTMIDVGSVERDFGEEFRRLSALYGKVVQELFPNVGGRASVPAGDDSIPAADEVQAANEAAKEAMSAAKSKRGKKAAPKKAPAETVPSLDDLPSE
jgi:hypothetical protein